MLRLPRVVLLQTLSAAAFAALATIAVRAYPGGTRLEPDLPGFSFWKGYVSDLLNPVARNGEPNPTGSLAASSALLALIPGLTAAWWLLPRLAAAPDTGLGWARRLGYASTVGLLLAVFASANHHGALHTVGIFVGALPALVALYLASIRLRSLGGTARHAGHCGLFALTAGFISLSGYTFRQITGYPFAVLTPTTQKFALLGLVLWMLSTGWVRAARGQSRERAPRPDGGP